MADALANAAAPSQPAATACAPISAPTLITVAGARRSRVWGLDRRVALASVRIWRQIPTNADRARRIRVLELIQLAARGNVLILIQTLTIVALVWRRRVVEYSLGVVMVCVRTCQPPCSIVDLAMLRRVRGCCRLAAVGRALICLLMLSIVDRVIKLYVFFCSLRCICFVMLTVMSLNSAPSGQEAEAAWQAIVLVAQVLSLSVSRRTHV